MLGSSVNSWSSSIFLSAKLSADAAVFVIVNLVLPLAALIAKSKPAVVKTVLLYFEHLYHFPLLSNCAVLAKTRASTLYHAPIS